MGAADRRDFTRVRSIHAHSMGVVAGAQLLLGVPAISSIAALRLADLIALLAIATRRLQIAGM